MLESLLERDPLIQQACVVGEGRDFLAALIVPNLEQLGALEQLGPLLPDVDRNEAAGMDRWHTPDVVEHYERVVSRRLSGLPAHEQVRRFRLVLPGFTAENGELTSKRSLCRQAIAEHHGELIEAMYAR